MKCLMKLESITKTSDGYLEAMFNTVVPSGERDYKGFLKAAISREEMNNLEFDTLMEVTVAPVVNGESHD